MSNQLSTSHNLDFCDAPYDPGPIMQLAKDLGFVREEPDGIPWRLFRVGTCEGQWRSTPDAYEILSVINRKPGNGHFDDVLEWFEHSCRRDGKEFRIREVVNQRLRIHLIRKRGFILEGEDVFKRFAL